MKTYLIIFITCLSILFFANESSAQDQEALTLSNNKFYGTARMQGLGGTYSSLGGDVSSALINPAGLGFYRRSEFTFSMAFGARDQDIDYLGNNGQKSNKGFFNVGNIAYVSNNTKKDFVPDLWRGGNWAFSYNRTNSFKQEYTYNGFNEQNDIIDFYVQEKNKRDGDYSDLAYENYLIDSYSDGNGSFYDRYMPTTVPYADNKNDYSTYQKHKVKNSGYENQWNVAYGANYDDKLFLGGSASIHFLNYKQETSYYEDYADTLLISQELSEIRTTNGTGLSLNLGAIYKPTASLNIALAIKTPTFYWLNEELDIHLITDYNNWNYISGEKDVSSFYDETLNRNPSNRENKIENPLSGIDTYAPLYINKWRLRTPMKINGGATYFIKKYGFITANAEWIDYQQMHISSNDFDTKAANEAIKNNYQSVLNIKVGAEIRIKSFRLRAGYGHYEDPIKDNIIDGTRKEYSFGIGIKKRNWYADIAFTDNNYQTLNSPYSLDYEVLPSDNGTDRILSSPIAEISNHDWRSQLTVGFTF